LKLFWGTLGKIYSEVERRRENDEYDTQVDQERRRDSVLRKLARDPHAWVKRERERER